MPSLSQKGDQSVDLQRPVGFSESDAPLIHFYLREAPPLFVFEEGSRHWVHAYFQFDDRDGLSFLWFSELQELKRTMRADGT